jgi:hypothetical protein
MLRNWRKGGKKNLKQECATVATSVLQGWLTSVCDCFTRTPPPLTALGHRLARPRHVAASLPPLERELDNESHAPVLLSAGTGWLSLILFSSPASTPSRFVVKFAVDNPLHPNSSCTRVYHLLATRFHPLTLPLLTGIAPTRSSSLAEPRSAAVSPPPWPALPGSTLLFIIRVLVYPHLTVSHALVFSLSARRDARERHRLRRSRPAAMTIASSQ